MKGKIIILVTCLFLAIGSASARSLVLTLKNGTHVYYLLGKDSNPMLRFVDGGMVINTDRYEFSSLKNFYISATDDPNGIEHVMDDMVQYGDNKVVVDTDKLTDISIYTLDGCRVNTHTLQANGKVTIDLTSLPQGTYVITIGGSSLKILKR